MCQLLLTHYEYKKATLTTDYNNDKLISMVDNKLDGNDEKPYHYTCYEYDDFGRLVGYSEINSSAESSLSVINKNKIVYTYDVNDRATDINYHESDDEVKGLKFEYNNDDWLINIKVKIKRNFLIGEAKYREYTYDAHGKVKNIKLIL